MTAALRRAGTSLAVPNYRRYFAGQVVSVSGNWMQNVAEMWLSVGVIDRGRDVELLGGHWVLVLRPCVKWGAMKKPSSGSKDAIAEWG